MLQFLTTKHCVMPTMKMTAKYSFETPVLTYQQDHNISFHLSENLKSRTIVTCLKPGELFGAGNKSFEMLRCNADSCRL